MASLIQQVTELLLSDERLKSLDGQLLKNLTQELARKNDPNLIRLMLSEQQIKNHFFIDIDGTLIFDKDKFIRFITSKEFLPNSYTAFKNKIGLAAGIEFIDEKKDVVVNWPYKDCILEGGMTKVDQKHDEIFYSSTLEPDEVDILLDPKVFTNFVRFSPEGEIPNSSLKISETGLIHDNLVIKGNNLLVLHSLCKQFRGKVKLIYIDPPFNTKTDSFGYNDNFNHSTWLTFMKNRLEISRELLSDDGSIYIHLDFNEVHYCKVLMDELFGRDNFQREIVWRIGWVSGYKTAAKNWIRNHDTILFYSKRNLTFNKEYIPYPENYVRRDGNPPEGNGYAIEDTWNCSELDKLDSIQIKSFDQEKTGFLTQKNEDLLRRIIYSSTSENDIVLDFFAGSGTTGATAHKMNRRYIMVEQIDDQLNILKDRIKAVINGDTKGISKKVNWQGGGDFVYMELAKWNQVWIDKIEAAINSDELIQIWEEMNKKAFLSYKVDPKTINESAKEFKDLTTLDQKRFLIECLDKNHLYINYSEIEDLDYGLTEEEIRLNREFYG